MPGDIGVSAQGPRDGVSIVTTVEDCFATIVTDGQNCFGDDLAF